MRTQPGRSLLRKCRGRAARSRSPASASAGRSRRLGWQPPATHPQGRSSRSCQRQALRWERTCSRKRRPPPRPGPAALRQRARGSSTVQRTRADHRVEAAVVEGKVLGRRLDHAQPPRGQRRPRLERSRSLRHVRVGLGQDQLGHRLGVVGQVEAGPGADLERAAARPRQQRAARGRRARRRPAVVEPGEIGLVVPGEESMISTARTPGYDPPERPAVALAARK